MRTVSVASDLFDFSIHLSPSSSSLLSLCGSYCPTPSTSIMSWINTLRTSAEDFGTLAENELPTFQSGCKAQMDGAACTEPAMSELCDTAIPPWRQISLKNHHDENSRRTTKSFQWIQEEDRGGMPSCYRSVKKGSKGTQNQKNKANEDVEGKDQGLNMKIEEILTLMKEMNRGQKEKRGGESKKR